MECSLAMTFKDFAIVASDATNSSSIIVLNENFNKTHNLSDHLLMSVNGESGDTIQFAEFIAKNVQLFKMRSGFELSPSGAANFTRRNMADNLRSRIPFFVNLIIVGFDKEKECCEMYYLDYLASMVKVRYAAHGYGGFFATAIMDRDYRVDMSQGQAYNLLCDCIKEIQKRLIINLPNFKVQLINKGGVKNLKDITVKNLS